jgi:O-antigen/teichoic acid export membrane protein
MLRLRERLRGDVAKNTIWSLADEAVSLVTGVVSLLLIIPHLGNGPYGAYAAMFALVGPFEAFAQSGVALTILEHTVRNDERWTVVARSCLSITLVVGCALTPVCIALSILLYSNLGTTAIVLFVLSELIAMSLWLNVSALVQATRSYHHGIVLRMVGQLIRILAVVGLVLADSVTVGRLAALNLIVFSGLAAFAIAVVLRQDGKVLLPGRIVGSHLRSTFTYAVGISASTAHNEGDKSILEASAARHPGETGVYAAGQRVVAMAMVPLQALATSTHFAVLRSARETTNQRRKAFMFTLVGCAYAVPIIGTLMLVAPVVPRILGDDFAGTTEVIRWLAPVVVLRGLSVFPMNGLLGLGHNALRTRLLVLNAVLSLSLYLLLIPANGWKGAMVATLLTESFSLLSAWTMLTVKQRQAERTAAAPLADDDAILAELIAEETELAQDRLV